ncbi:XRE family transcriptional regulator [Enterococcus hirae]|uniref:XRE family transcriptional regulator n=1 Tax=Enterococcus hirae TaxID=1354 RepID=UPI0015F289CA|nr:S24 family peptidase [Enterococcus hirae]MBA5264133.1 helix-turn-helix domain-containing protein [Enterococcus hirae]
MKKNILGSVIKDARKKKKLTQEQLSKLTGYSQNTISNHENGNRSLDEDNIKTYATALDLTSDDLFEALDIKNSLENKMMIIDKKQTKIDNLLDLYSQLEESRQTKVYNFAEYQLREQNKRPKTTIEIRGYVSAGTGEWLEDEIVDEVSYEGVMPEHDFAVKVNGDSMLPLFEDGQVIFIKSTSDVRDGQIIVCQVNNEAFVKKLSGNKLVSLNKKYEDISICDTDDFKIYGVVVL